MTRTAVLFSSAVYILTAIPYGSAGPACAKKYWQQQSCVEQCKGKWGYPGLMMGSGPWGAVIQKTEEDDWNSVIASACGMPVSSTPAASATVAGAVANSPASTDVSSAVMSTTEAISSTSVISSSSSAPSASFSISNATISTSSSFNIIFSTGTFAPPAPTTSSTEEQISTSTSQFTPPATTTSTSSIEQAPQTTSTTPAPAPTTSSVVAAVASPTSSSSSSASTSSGSNGSGASDSDVQEYLSAHNSVRAQHGASTLTWSNDAATKAQQWADNCVFQHSGGTLGPFGENLAAGTGSGYGISQAIDSWSSEASQYDPSNPVASHFTQMVWKATTQVGCAVASCSGIFAASFGLASFYVCEYSPQGNVIGEFAQNVQA
ncbi:PR-1-like protein [Lentinula aciculospora]|uniref:PR-1-like protein n=1 Tax=Lentinula aciculospora TaxID=153920 RepID=A0A9W9AME8_9AGAR|nr:PR-1-like protein [Lentinula aciculospora]